MRSVFIVIIVLHALLHLPGFIKGMGIREIRELSAPISRPQAFLWLTASFVFVLYGLMYGLGRSYDWLLGVSAVFVSQLLIFSCWKDARYGTILNVLIMVVSVISYGEFRFKQIIWEETSAFLSRQALDRSPAIIQESDLTTLPIPVQNWLRRSGAVGKPVIQIGRVTQRAEMKLKPDQENWMPATAIQYTLTDTPGFIWSVGLKMNPLMFVTGRDKLDDGEGYMRIVLNGWVDVVNDRGGRLNEGSLQRFLGEMVWFPSLALSPYIVWETLSDTVARATLNYAGCSATGIFYFNLNGDVLRFFALRYKDNTENARKYGWVMDISGYRVFEGIRVPSVMTSTWKLEAGDWTWLKLEVVDLRFNGRSVEGGGKADRY